MVSGVGEQIILYFVVQALCEPLFFPSGIATECLLLHSDWASESKLPSTKLSLWRIRETRPAAECAEAKKAGIESTSAERIPSPPNPTGRVACFQAVEKSDTLQILSRHVLWRLSKSRKIVGCFHVGQVLRVYNRRGEPRHF